MYNVIDDWWGIDAESFVREVNGLDVDTLNIRINSPGGDVFTARAMQTALAQHPAHVVVHVDGLAASAATFLAMGANEVRISDGAFFMIHQGWAFMMGNADELREHAELLDAIDDSIAKTYATRTGLSYEQVMAMMAAETWMSGQQAVDNGFADRIMDGIADTEPSIDNKVFDLSAYQHPPDRYNQPAIDNSAALRAHLERRLALIA
ncbi:head maturation protease, ClpP-related [Endozoicomonas sp. SESOKO1]|uniref:head maturation protease, ClpP-related n=1 Tax=Endozoicomonas sp. SESOKO1 TaxID=2828742 RepID=UPI0021488706